MLLVHVALWKKKKKKTVLSGHLISRLVVAFYSGSCFAVLLSFTHAHVDLNIVFDNTIRKCMEITSGLIQAIADTEHIT